MSITHLVASLFFISLISSQTTFAQRTQRHFDAQARPYYRGPLRVTLGGGAGFYNGDLGGLENSFLGPAVSVGVLYRVRPHVLLGSELSYIETGGRDRLPERGLAFYSTNGLLTTFLRYDVLHDASAYNALHTDTPPFQVFVQAGLGVLLYNPKSYVGTGRPETGTSYLAPERNDYPAMAGTAPVGAGLSIRISDELRATLEGNYYFTTSDHLDDVSLRGNPGENDGFGTFMLKADYVF